MRLGARTQTEGRRSGLRARPHNGPDSEYRANPRSGSGRATAFLWRRGSSTVTAFLVHCGQGRPATCIATVDTTSQALTHLSARSTATGISVYSRGLSAGAASYGPA